MSYDYYKIYVDNVCVAERVTLEFAVIFTKAIFNEFYNETDLKVTIQKIDLNTEECKEYND